MRDRIRTFAHTLERSGLALAGAACGMFVGAYVGSSIEALTTQGFLLAMEILRWREAPAEASPARLRQEG